MKPTPEMIKKVRLLAADGNACINSWQCHECPLNYCDTIIKRESERLAAEWLKENGVE